MQGSMQALVTVEDYVKANDYRIRVCKIGKIVVVSGIIYGTGRNEYLDFALPIFSFNSQISEAGALVFMARNQSTGAYKTLRAGGGFAIYRESDMPSGIIYSFAFSYNSD